MHVLHKIKLWYREAILVCFLACAVCLVLPFSIKAAPLPGLGITPLRFKPDLNPGQTSTNTITISNQSPTNTEVDLSVEQFKTTDQDYNYQFSPAEHADWIRLADKTVSLQPKSTLAVAYSLAIPANASPGGYYFAIVASSAGQNSTTNLKEIKRVASLIYLNVNGDISKKASIVGLDVPWFTNQRQIQVETHIANQGNSHFDARLTTKAKPLLGEADSAQTQAMILPGTIRKLETNVRMGFWPGIYRLHTQFAPPQGGTLQITRTIFYAPSWLWVCLLLAGFGVIGWTKKHRSGKKYKA